MADAVGLLTGDERSWLPESASGVISLIDDTFSNYEESSGAYEDSGSADLVQTALNRANASEDWARVKTALEAAIEK